MVKVSLINLTTVRLIANLRTIRLSGKIKIKKMTDLFIFIV